MVRVQVRMLEGLRFGLGAEGGVQVQVREKSRIKVMVRVRKGLGVGWLGFRLSLGRG